MSRPRSRVCHSCLQVGHPRAQCPKRKAGGAQVPKSAEVLAEVNTPPAITPTLQKRYGAILDRLGKVPDKHLAHELECSTETVGILRRRLGIPPAPRV